MLTISKALSAAQLRTYHAEEFSNARGNYYTGDEQIRGHWHGRLAQQWGLSGSVHEEHVHRLADGRHPMTDTTLVRSRASRVYVNAHGDTVRPMEHRAGWDATFSAPKSVSLTALVGGDLRIAAAHRASVRAALDETERYVQARVGGNHPAETTGKWITAAFEHDSARPVEGYAAPQLHTHVVIFNVTECRDGQTRALQPRELYKTQQYATAVYRSELASRLVGFGYEIERGSSGQPEISGYTSEYLEASSPRRQQIQAHLESAQQSGAGAAQIAARLTRELKLDVSQHEMQRRHREMAKAFGDQPDHVVGAATRRETLDHRQAPQTSPQAALTFAQDRNFEREAVVDERTLLRDALRRSMGEVTVGAIQSEFARHVEAGNLVAVEQPRGAAARMVTSHEVLELERDTLEVMRAGQQTQSPLVTHVTRHDIDQAYPHLSEHQRGVVNQILGSRDQVQALEGIAGSGKTTALTAVRDGAQREGYRVEGFAPTSRAAQKLAEAGIASSTLQGLLAQREGRSDGRPRLYVLDESSLASTRQMNAFLHRLTGQDRVLLVGDVRQHQAVEAGRPYQQLQEAGIQIARLDHIVRQRDPALKQVIEHLSRGEVTIAIQQMEEHGRVSEIADRGARLTAIAKAYAANPDETLVVSPDNQSRTDINQIIHRLLQDAGRVDEHERHLRVLVPRQDVTGADRQWAEQYAVGDVVRYTTGSRPLRLRAGEYRHVVHVNAHDNQLTVARRGGEHITYDPRRLHGVTLFQEADRTFARGDRVQFTSPYRARKIANRELGTVEKIATNGDFQLRLDSGRSIRFNVGEHPHLDYGYAVTSHSSQGQTADRVLVHVDTERLGEQLVNQRLAYVAISRGRYDAQIYTNDKAQLANALSREVSHRSAIEPGRTPASPTRQLERSGSRSQAAEVTITR
jgi:conjugative relaxase-like TrwC/TraI family protein